MTGSFPSLRDSVGLLEDWEEPVNVDLIGWRGHLHLVRVKEEGGV